MPDNSRGSTALRIGGWLCVHLVAFFLVFLILGKVAPECAEFYKSANFKLEPRTELVVGQAFYFRLYLLHYFVAFLAFDVAVMITLAKLWPTNQWPVYWYSHIVIMTAFIYSTYAMVWLINPIAQR